MNLQEPLKISSIDLSKIVYPKERSKQDKKIILVKLNERNKLKNFVFQTPSLLNLSKTELNKGYAEIELALVGKESNKINNFVKFLSELENKIKYDAQYNASSWFNITEENQSINFQKIIRESPDYSEGTIKIKLIKNNDFETIIQLNNNKRISINEIPDDSWCKMILETYAIWINSNNDFGIFFRPILVSFIPKEKETYNYKFAEESEEENEFDVPDTEVKNNVFMKIEQPNKDDMNRNDSTSILEINELIKHLESESETEQPDSEVHITYDVQIVDNNIKIDLSDANLTDSESDDNSAASSDLDETSSD